MKATILHTFLLSCLLIASGCSGPPSQSAGDKLMRNRVESQSKGGIRLVSFKKTNAVAGEGFYVMEYRAEVQFMQTGTWSRGGSMDTTVYFEFSADRLPQNNLAQLMGSAMGAVNVQQGEHKTVTGTLRFQKTEQGWRGEDGELY